MARRKAKSSRSRSGTLDDMLKRLREEDSERAPAEDMQTLEQPPAEEQPEDPGDWSYLLAVIERGYENKVRGFIESLPADAGCVLKASGYAGSLESTCLSPRRSKEREFLIFRAASFDNLDLEYFATSPEARVMEIPDELAVRYYLKVQDTDMATGSFCQFCRSGTIAEAIGLYKKESQKDPRTLLLDSFMSVDFTWENMTRDTWFGLGKRKVLPTYVAVGLETLDGEYLLIKAGPHGPYDGKLSKAAVKALGR